MILETLDSSVVFPLRSSAASVVKVFEGTGKIQKLTTEGAEFTEEDTEVLGIAALVNLTKVVQGLL